MDNTITLDETMEYELLKKEYAIESITSPASVMYDALDMYNTSIKEIASLELMQKASGEVAIFEAVLGGESLWVKFINAAKVFFQKMLENIIMVWNWAAKMLDKYITANGIFLSKYGKILETIDSVKFEKGYKFTDLEPPSVYKLPVPDKLTAISDDDKKLMKDKIISKITNGRLVTSQGSPTQEIHNIYYGPLLVDETYSIKDQLDFLKNCTVNKKKIVVPFKAAVAEMRTLAYTLDAVAKVNASTDAKHIMAYVELSKYNAEVLFAAYTEYTKAIIDRTNQARAICIQALSNQVHTNSAIENENTITESNEFKSSKYSVNSLILN